MKNLGLVRILRAGSSALALAALTVSIPASAQADDAVVETKEEIVNPGPVEAWGLEPTDVQPDPAIRYGRLGNGMRYAIRPNSTPDGAVSMRLHVDFGSLYEAENERGLAHFIEHMAFNGSTNVPEGEMLPMLERLGFAFGPDTNALTDFDKTIYQLDISTANEERIDSALFLLRETASELTFAPEAVDRERGVITSERRTRDTVGLRNAIHQIDFLMPDALYADRLPIGVEEVLNTAPADRLKELYHRYYRPENTTLVVVGDMDIDAIEAKIKGRFGDWQPTGSAGEKPDVGKVDLERPMSFGAFVDPAVASTVQIAVHRPYDDPMDTIAQRFKSQLEEIAMGMLSSRIQRIAQQPDSVLLGGQALDGEFKWASDYALVAITTKDGEWERGLTVAEQEVRRAIEHGFTQAELERSIANFDTTYRQSVDQAEARATRSLAEAIVSNAADNDLNTHPAWRYSLWQSYKNQITLDRVNEAFRALWNGSKPLIHVATKELEGGEQAIADAFKASVQMAVAPPQDVAVAEFAYDSFGDAPGKVVSDTMIEDLGIRTITFDNNVRLNIKRTDFEPGRIRFNIAMDGGVFALPGSDFGNIVFFQVAGATMGTVQHSAQEFNDILAGKSAVIGLTSAEDSFVVSGATNAEFLDLQMKVSAAYLTDNGFRGEAQAQWNAVLDVIYNQLLSNPALVFQLKGVGAITQDDPRFTLPSKEVLGGVSQEAFREAFHTNASDAAVEIAIVGDVDEDAAIAAIANTFGALPARKLEFVPHSEEREVKVKDTLEPLTLYHTGPADQALAAAVWRTADDGDHRTEVAMDLLKEVVAIKALEVLREELGTTYTPSVSSDMSDTFEDYGTLSVSAVVAPDDIDRSIAAIPAIMGDIRDNGIDADLLTRARQPLIEQHEAAKRGNGFWLGVTASAQRKAERLDRARQRGAILAEVTADELQALAKQYITPERRLDVRVLSDKAAQTAE
ncbi:insulinase family protein [Pontixanthobacter aestiaquae]|nr:insulinase family protein [Pontixanthobacter aestiaquae]MDN3645890.1 insulinase family protein [Pontixanthobacter aestiaquae]